MTKVIQSILFGSAYVPLLLLILLKNEAWHWFEFCFVPPSYRSSLAVAITFFLAFLILFAPKWFLSFCLKKKQQEQGAVPIDIQSVEPADDQVMTYLITYLLAFFNFNWADIGTRVALIAFFLGLGVVYVKTGIIYVNPWLQVLGYHLYKVTSDDGRVYYVITRKTQIEERGKVNAYKLAQNAYLLDENIG